MITVKPHPKWEDRPVWGDTEYVYDVDNNVDNIDNNMTDALIYKAMCEQKGTNLRPIALTPLTVQVSESPDKFIISVTADEDKILFK